MARHHIRDHFHILSDLLFKHLINITLILRNISQKKSYLFNKFVASGCFVKAIDRNIIFVLEQSLINIGFWHLPHVASVMTLSPSSSMITQADFKNWNSNFVLNILSRYKYKPGNWDFAQSAIRFRIFKKKYFSECIFQTNFKSHISLLRRRWRAWNNRDFISYSQRSRCLLDPDCGGHLWNCRSNTMSVQGTVLITQSIWSKRPDLSMVGLYKNNTYNSGLGPWYFGIWRSSMLESWLGKWFNEWWMGIKLGINRS